MHRAAAQQPTEVASFSAAARREHLRWLCLCQLDAARPEMTTDEALLAQMRTIYPDATLRDLRREVDYLEMRALLHIERRNQGWSLKLTWQGIDVVEYTSDCPPGIGRPKK